MMRISYLPGACFLVLSAFGLPACSAETETASQETTDTLFTEEPPASLPTPEKSSQEALSETPAATLSKPATTAANAGQVDMTDGKSIVFYNGTEFYTDLFELEYIGSMGGGDSKRFLILSGRACEECDANETIYLLSPEDGAVEDASMLPRFIYPGQEKSYEDGQVLNKSRFFFGEVLPETEGAIWYQQTMDIDKNEYVDNALLVTVQADTLDYQVLTGQQMPGLPATLQLVEQGKAVELPGKEYFNEP